MDSWFGRAGPSSPSEEEGTEGCGGEVAEKPSNTCSRGHGEGFLPLVTHKHTHVHTCTHTYTNTHVHMYCRMLWLSQSELMREKPSLTGRHLPPGLGPGGSPHFSAPSPAPPTRQGCNLTSSGKHSWRQLSTGGSWQSSIGPCLLAQKCPTQTQK